MMTNEEELIGLFAGMDQPLPAVLGWREVRGASSVTDTVLFAVLARNGRITEIAVLRRLLQAGQDALARPDPTVSQWLSSLLTVGTPAARALAATALEATGENARAAEQFMLVAAATAGEVRVSCLLSAARLWELAGVRPAAERAWTDAVKGSLSARLLGNADKLASRLEQAGGLPARRYCRIGLVGSVTLDFLVPPLRAICRAYGVRAEFWVGGFAQQVQDLMGPAPGLATFKPDIVIIACDWRSLGLPEEGEDAAALVEAKVAEFKAMWQACRDGLRAHIIQFNFELPLHGPYGRLSAVLPTGMGRLLHEINRRFFDAEQEMPGLTIADIDQVSGGFGKRRWSSAALWFAAKQYPSPEALPALARYLGALIRAVMGLTAKCLVLDLDGTLWGGVIGEDGVANLALGGEGAGEAYAGFQKYLKALKQRGIVLAVCSKNNEADARLPFTSHPDMVLTLDDITLFVANWQPKEENLAGIARTLNLGLDSLVFVDDNPAERERVRQRLPAVEVVDLPADPALYIEALEQHLPFETLAVSAEDRQRVKTYRENQDREMLRAKSASVADFLAGLDMTVELRPFDPASLPRITQLINKTNQFNLTTRRFTEGQIAALIGAPGVYTQSMRLRDRYGDYGLTGVLIARAEGSSLKITDWLMSCRVIGRGVEEAMLASLMREIHGTEFVQLTGEFIPSAKTASFAIYTRAWVSSWSRKRATVGEPICGIWTATPFPCRRESGFQASLPLCRFAYFPFFMQSRIQNVFREVFDEPGLVISDGMSAKDVPEWDSLAQVKLIIALEEEFGVKFTTNEVAEMKCVGDLKQALQQKQNDR